MNFKDLPETKKIELAEMMFQTLDSAQELKDWIMFFLGLDMPMESVDPDSNSSPIDAMWEIYNAVKTNSGDVIPGYIMLSARECYKCQVKGSKLLTPNGLINIENAQIGDTIWTGFSWQKITNHIYDGFKVGITVEVDGGLKFTGSPIHRYWVLREGKEQWVKSNDLKEESDLIAVNVDTGIAGKAVVDHEVYRAAYSMAISWSNTEMELVSEKVIPQTCYSNVDAMKGFISGLIDVNGKYKEKGNIILSFVSFKLLEEIQKILISFGIFAKLNKKNHSLAIAYSDLSILIANGISVFTDKIKKTQEFKVSNTHDTIPKTQVKWFLDLCNSYGYIQIKNRQYKKRSYGKYKNISVNTLAHLCSWMEENAQHGHVNDEDRAKIKTMRKILRNKWHFFKLKNEYGVEFYDLTVEKDHSYWSNGSISHNTLGASILETLLMLHFEVTIAHMAAIQSQSAKAVQYINYFFTKVEPLLEVSGWTKTSENKNKISFRTKNGEDVYIRVIVATMAGANCIDPASLIAVDGRGSIPAVEIQPGDRILTRNYKTGEDVYVTSKGMQVTDKPARKLTLDSGRQLIVSDDHPIFTDSGWVRASQVRLGSKVIVNQKLPEQTSIYSQEFDIKRSLDQVILGTLLGNGSIHRLPSGKIRYSTSHCRASEDYIYLIASIFKSNGIEVNICKDRENLKLISVTSPLLNKFYDLAINPITKHKTVTKKWLDALTDEGIAYWLMDDGRGNSFKVGSCKDHHFSLATCGFSTNENELIAHFFKQKGYSVKIGSVTNQSKKIYGIIDFSLSSSRNLSQIVSPYFVKSLRYKLLSSHTEATQRWALDSGEMREVPHIKHKTLFWDKNPNLKSERQLKKNILLQLNETVTQITPLGISKLVDIAVENEDKTLHSFYANGMLVHNSEHTLLMFVDEVDVVANPQAYEEAKLIPGYSKGKYPITVKLSTRKFAFGLMQQEIDKAAESGDRILRWNILDVTEKCPPTRHLPELPKANVYIAKDLPLKHISVEDYENLSDVEKPKYELLENVHGGCVGCRLLPICKTRLSRRSDQAASGPAKLYKPITTVINTFKKTNPDMASAQLMCWKPSSKGLVYPRFESVVDKGNVRSMDSAWEVLTGDKPLKKVNEADLLYKMRTLEIPFYAGVDWGYTHDFVVVIFAKIPNGEIWIVDCFSAPGLEFSDCLEVGKVYRDKYNIQKWFCDTAMPSHIKSFNKNGMKSPQFAKDVMGGIEALRSKIVDGSGRRLLQVIDCDATQKVKFAFVKHHFKLDGQGNPTLVPDDTPGTADQADAMRYVAQNLFPVKGPQKPGMVVTEEMLRQGHNPTNTEQMREEVSKRVTDGPMIGGNGKKGGFHWQF